MNLINLKKQDYKFLITGGTGYIGSKLILAIKDQSQEITILSRKAHKSNDAKIKYINNLDDKEFDYDVIINLSGEIIAQIWTKKSIKRIWDSRIDITKKLVKKISQAKHKPQIFISGSAIGVYGTTPNKKFDEDCEISKQNLFSQDLCLAWEEEAKKAAKLTNLAIIRTGVVLGKKSNFIKKLLPIFKFGLGGKIASGKQILSWIHINDEIRAILFLINNKLSGEFNLCSPNSVSNEEFSKIFAKTLKRPALFAIPAISMKLIYAKMADELLLNGQDVYPARLINKGFEFQFNNISSALKKELS